MPKRLVLCCDGTWMDSDDGFNEPTLIPYVPTATLQVQSNVTRIARALTKVDAQGNHQIIFYHSGVGTSSSMFENISGGALGKGISENIREAYSFIAANYALGDEIILIGFSRGAFTARSVAGMIDNIGLLTRAGMDSFYPIFKDQENFKTPSYHDIFPTIPFPKKPKGPNAARDYKRRLEELGLTRISDSNEDKICVQAVAVWDTVGSLGIPNISLLAKLGIPHSTKEYKFYNTDLSGTIKHAFQALALDEHRRPFSPAVWERKSMDTDTTVDLRQVWFPGSHANVGGGYDDQEIANISLAWMMDQLASIGVAFQDEYIEHIFSMNVKYYEDPAKYSTSTPGIFSRKKDKKWAIEPIYSKHKPVRPWGLGEIYNSSVGFYAWAGKEWRTPGLNVRADPDNGQLTDIPMENTNERIHSCVRIRLDLEGLGLDDHGLYKCHALLSRKLWRLRHVRMKVQDPIAYNASWGPTAPGPANSPDDMRWVWEYCGPADGAPKHRYMVEENLGPYERQLLLLNKARPPKRHHRKKKKKTKSSRNTSTTVRSRTTRINSEESDARPILQSRDQDGEKYEDRSKRHSIRYSDIETDRSDEKERYRDVDADGGRYPSRAGTKPSRFRRGGK